MPTSINLSTNDNKLPHGRLVLVAIALLVAVASGCTRIRLPAIDPTGTTIFSPLPTTTTLALPGAAGEGPRCLERLRSLSLPRVRFPEPAFTQPADPPQCLEPTVPVATETIGLGQASDEPFVASADCNGQCKDGPPAVLYGKETEVRDLLRLPKRGKRGCILLSPQRIVAPVGGEVILLSGICGTDGYLQMGETLEWMLTPDSVGTLIQVGDDDPGFVHRLARIKKPKKQDGSYAIGVTSTKRTLITRGNLTPIDDVQLEKGQTWISLSSPSEGTSHVTVLAPESECWDNRKATATIYWIDAKATYPVPQNLPAGTTATLKTRVTRSDGVLPARGWKVRYEIMQPELASFAGTNGSSVVEVNVDDSGMAAADLVPTAGTSGSAVVNISVIRPGGVRDNMPDLPISQGQAFVTWSAPQLEIIAGAPEVATFGVPVQVVINVRNPGNQPASNVIVGIQIPNGVSKAESPDKFAQNVPSAVTWDIGTIPPQTELDLFLNVTPEATIDLEFQGRADGNLMAQDQVRIDVFRPSLVITAEPVEGQHEAGQPVTFVIDIKNTGDRVIKELALTATGDGAMIHKDTGKQEVSMQKQDGPLQPGDDWYAKAVFVPTDAGRRCINVEATGSGGQRAQVETCVIVINPIPETPAMTMKISGPKVVRTGERVKYFGRVTNTGQVPLTDVRVTMTYDPQMTPIQATSDGLSNQQLGQYLFSWNIPSFDPGVSRPFVVEFEPTQINPRSQIIMTARSAQGAVADDTFTFEIQPGTPPAKAAPPAGPGNNPSAPLGGGLPVPGTERLPNLPPVLPTPEVPPPIPAEPGGARPGAANTPRPSTPIPGIPAPTTSERLQISLAARDNPVRVNDLIRYTMRVTNDSTTSDSEVQLQFELPPGVSVRRVVQTGSPETNEIIDRAGIIYLPDIRFMRPGESIDYEIVLVSNQPQTFVLVMEAVSRNLPGGTAVKTQTTVIN